MKRPRPIFAAGWISMPVSTLVTFASTRGASGTPASCMACVIRCESRAWTPP